MSQSIPHPQNSNPSPSDDFTPATFTLPDARRTGWGLSIVLHLCALGLLLWIGSAERRKHHAESPMQGQSAAIDPKTTEARRQVGELVRAQQELQRIQGQTQAEYRNWRRDRTRAALPAMRESVRQAGKALEQAANAQKRAEASRSKIEQIGHALEKAKTLGDQSKLLTRMEHAEAEMAHAQAQVRQAQDRGAQAYQEGAKSLEFAERVPAPRAQAVRKAFDSASQALSLARDAQSNAEQPRSALAEQVRQVKQELALEAKAKAQQEKSAAGKPKPQVGGEEARHTQEQEARQAADRDARQKPLTQQLPPQIANAQHMANQAQERARQMQPPLEQAVRQASTMPPGPKPAETALHHMGTQEGGPHGAAEGAPGPHGGGIEGEKAGIAGLYTTAVNAERANVEAYRQIQAHATAMAKGIPVERALEATDATAPVRPSLDHPGKPGAEGVPDASLSREQREEARQQIAAMSTLGRQMLDRARPHSAHHASGSPSAGPETAHGAEVAPAGLQAAMAPSAGRIALATEEDGHTAKDLTGGASGIGAGKTQHEAAGKGKWSDKAPDSIGHVVPPPPSPPVDIKAVPGRVVGSGTMGAGWMFVDTWHTVGPFPNPQRQNINKSFPPESGVDLDAAYIGKDNRTVHWKWLQTASPMLVPNDPEEYAIYYGYTELWFDAPADLWIAIGSDDKSTVWIDDQLVWISSDMLKGWRIDEGLRKVHFTRGLNRVLFRLENGWRGVGLSLCICLKPEKGNIP